MPCKDREHKRGLDKAYYDRQKEERKKDPAKDEAYKAHRAEKARLRRARIRKAAMSDTTGNLADRILDGLDDGRKLVRQAIESQHRVLEQAIESQHRVYGLMIMNPNNVVTLANSTPSHHRPEGSTSTPLCTIQEEGAPAGNSEENICLPAPWTPLSPAHRQQQQPSPAATPSTFSSQVVVNTTSQAPGLTTAGIFLPTNVTQVNTSGGFDSVGQHALPTTSFAAPSQRNPRTLAPQALAFGNCLSVLDNVPQFHSNFPGTDSGSRKRRKRGYPADEPCPENGAEMDDTGKFPLNHFVLVFE